MLGGGVPPGGGELCVELYRKYIFVGKSTPLVVHERETRWRIRIVARRRSSALASDSVIGAAADAEVIIFSSLIGSTLTSAFVNMPGASLISGTKLGGS